MKTIFYTNELLTGANSMEEAVVLQKGTHELLPSAHFPLHKYQSSLAEFLEGFPAEVIEVSLTRILGNIYALSLPGCMDAPEDVFQVRYQNAASVLRMSLSTDCCPK